MFGGLLVGCEVNLGLVEIVRQCVVGVEACDVLCEVCLREFRLRPSMVPEGNPQDRSQALKLHTRDIASQFV